MSIRVTVGFLMAALSLSPPAAEGQRPAELAFADPQPHFVAAWAPKKPREAERSAVLVRRVSLELTDVPLDLALKRLIGEAGLNITYSPAVLPAGKRVTIKAGDIAVVTALTEMLFRSGLDVMVDRDGTLALVVCRHPAPRAEVPDSGTVIGTVTSKSTRASLAGATVVVEGTGRTATTDGDGRYRLEDIPAGTRTVRVRYIGYAPLAVSVSVPAGGEVRTDFALAGSLQKLDELVTVTPGGMQTQLRALSSPITIVTAADIEQQRPQTLSDVFRRAVPGAVGFDVPFQPASTLFSLRGASTLDVAGQVKVFVDGVEAASLSRTPVDPSSIERIEVIRGPQASTVFGPDAAGGVIQIFTKRGDPSLTDPRVTARAEAGVQQTPYSGLSEAVSQSYGADIRGGERNATYNLGFSYWRLSDWLPDGENSSQSVPSVFGGLRYELGKLSFDLSGRYLVNNGPLSLNPLILETGFVPLSRPQFTRQKITNYTVGARLGLNPRPWWRNQLTVGVDQSSLEQIQQRSRLTTVADTFLSLALPSDNRASITYNTSLGWTPFAALSATLTLGFDYYRLQSTNFTASQVQNTDGTIRLGPSGAFAVSRGILTNTGYFAQAEMAFLESLFLTAGLRADDNSAFGENLGTPVSPRVGLAYTHEFREVGVKLRGSYGRAIKAPRPGLTFGFASPASITLANPLLAPERQRGWDAGLDVTFGVHGSLSLTGYDQIAQDLILFVQVAAAPVQTFQNQNVGRVKNRGVEAEGTLNLGDRLKIQGNYAYVQSRIEDLGPNFQGDQRAGDRPRAIPAHTAAASMSFVPRLGTTLTGGFAYVGSFRQYDVLAQLGCFGGTSPCRPVNREYLVNYPGFTKINAAVDQLFTSHVSASLSVDNLTNNQAYESINSFPVKGRLASLGLKVLF